MKREAREEGVVDPGLELESSDNGLLFFGEFFQQESRLFCKECMPKMGKSTNTGLEESPIQFIFSRLTQLGCWHPACLITLPSGLARRWLLHNPT